MDLDDEQLKDALLQLAEENLLLAKDLRGLAIRLRPDDNDDSDDDGDGCE